MFVFQSSINFGILTINLYFDHQYCIRKWLRTTLPTWQWFLEYDLLEWQVHKVVAKCQCFSRLYKFGMIAETQAVTPSLHTWYSFIKNSNSKLDLDDAYFEIKTHIKEYCTNYSCPNFYHNALILQWFLPSTCIFIELELTCKTHGRQINVAARCCFVIHLPSSTS